MTWPEASGRLIKWAIEPDEFNITFEPQVAIKAQTLADFLVELVPPPGSGTNLTELSGTDARATLCGRFTSLEPLRAWFL